MILSKHLARPVVALLTVAGALVAGTNAVYAQAPAPPTNLRVYTGTPTAPTVTVNVAPATVSIQPGGVVQFTATVTGTPNTAVVWSATGGTISSTGQYTVGQSSGTFRVTATISGGSIGGFATVAIQSAPSTGHQVAPGQDIQTVISAAPEGAIILLKSGVHRTQTITPRQNQTLIGEPGAILSGARVLTGWMPDGSRWYVGGQTQQGTVNTIAMCRTGFPRCAHPEDVFMNDVLKQHVGSLAEVGPGKWFFDYASDRIYVGDDPNGRTVETAVTPRAFAGSATGVNIKDLIVEKFASPIQRSAIEGGANWTIERTEVRWNHGGGIELAPSRIVRNSFIHHQGAIGIRGAGNNSLFEDNEISYNNTANVDDFWEAGGTKFAFTNGLIVRRNFVHHNSGPGLWTDIDNSNVLYENNLVEDNGRSGIFHEISYNAIIRNNTVRRNGATKPYPYWTTGAGIEITTSRDVEVYGNTLVDNWQGITVIDDHRGSWYTANVYVHDNKITVTAHPGNGGGRSGVHDTNGTGVYSRNIRFVNNTYDLPSNTAQYFFWQGEKSDTFWLSIFPTEDIIR